ncbi:MAG: hypothetical protein HC879_12220 [Leptolyngbyaceae cyanobacterium SL_5_9]|nr:hypothetical protein [Leptolyngbyaceae cyanobacterium SL_5_9]NJO73302.1 hypothetical protein [Leptolyngbyaceae cyanobacterium RM1_406_9]
MKRMAVRRSRPKNVTIQHFLKKLDWTNFALILSLTAIIIPVAGQDGLQRNISEFEGSVSPNRTVDEQGWRHLAFQVDSVDQTYQRLQAEGVEFLTEPFTYDPPGYKIAFFGDPEGNILELYQDL